jgi:hypothetical protein
VKERIAGAGTLALQLICIVLLAFPTEIRSYLYRQLYPLQSADAAQLAGTPDSLRTFGYIEDDPAQLSGFRAMAQNAVRTAATDGQRLRQIGDTLYAMRRDDAPVISAGREQGVHVVLGRMQTGEHGLAGHMTLVFSAMLRSIGRDFREVRFTTDDGAAWNAAHYGIELYLPDRRHWVYYDIALNGYAVDESGEPLSLAALSEHLAQGHDEAIVASTEHRDWDPQTFLRFLRGHQMMVFSLNNKLRTLDPDRRFGSLHFAYKVLSKLPRPFDRFVDAFTGDAAPRLVLSTHPAPADRAALHVSANSPIG